MDTFTSLFYPNQLQKSSLFSFANNLLTETVHDIIIFLYAHHGTGKKESL